MSHAKGVENANDKTDNNQLLCDIENENPDETRPKTTGEDVIVEKTEEFNNDTPPKVMETTPPEIDQQDIIVQELDIASEENGEALLKIDEEMEENNSNFVAAERNEGDVRSEKPEESIEQTTISTETETVPEKDSKNDAVVDDGMNEQKLSIVETTREVNEKTSEKSPLNTDVPEEKNVDPKAKREEVRNELLADLGASSNEDKYVIIDQNLDVEEKHIVDPLQKENTDKKTEPEFGLVHQAEAEEPTWQSEKAKCLKASEDERRQKKECVTELHSIETWPQYFNKIFRKDLIAKSPEIGDKVSIWKGDITSLLIDAIVNAANEKLLGGGGVDGAIHAAAGRFLVEECRGLGGCLAGESVITGAYNIPAKYVIHTVGPRGENPDKLRKCYESSLDLLIENGARSIAFPCISTGIFGYPNEKAAEVVLQTVSEWLEKNHDKVDRVIFCLFLEKDVKFYETKMRARFPMDGDILPIVESTPDPVPDQKEPGLGNTSDLAERKSQGLLTWIFNYILSFFWRIYNWVF